MELKYPFHRWGSWGLDILNNFPEVSWLTRITAMCFRAEIQLEELSRGHFILLYIDPYLGSMGVGCFDLAVLTLNIFNLYTEKKITAGLYLSDECLWKTFFFWRAVLMHFVFFDQFFYTLQLNQFQFYFHFPNLGLDYFFLCTFYNTLWCSPLFLLLSFVWLLKRFSDYSLTHFFLFGLYSS